MLRKQNSKLSFPNECILNSKNGQLMEKLLHAQPNQIPANSSVQIPQSG